MNTATGKTGAVPYDPSQNEHSLEGARAAFRALFEGVTIRSLLDVGCGPGTWMRAAMDGGVPDVWGVDGLAMQASQVHVPLERILVRDLGGAWDLGRTFDAVLCLEVAEHLPEPAAAGLIDALTRHSDRVYFSAANPWQQGQNHVHCRWPAYWQNLFNRQGYVCRDEVRWRIWDLRAVEPWYRQNLFLAVRDPKQAGREPRIPAVIHPDCMVASFESWRQSREGLLVAAARWADRWVAKLRGRPVGFPGEDTP